ncbi:hypothetical protein HRU45_04065 [Candidatus Dependentiae bacterium]|nr:hypothetical protein [Candidatus Dependentiae bacterium]
MKNIIKQIIITGACLLLLSCSEDPENQTRAFQDPSLAPTSLVIQNHWLNASEYRVISPSGDMNLDMEANYRYC